MTGRKAGRPVSSGRGHAGPRVTVRLSPGELYELERVASEKHLTVATYVREAALDRLARERAD